MNRIFDSIHPYARIALAGVLVWGVTLSFGFVWDDFPMISSNASLHDWRTILTGFGSDFWGLHDSKQVSGYWRPIVTVVHVIWTHLAGGNPAWFHGLNVVLHIANAILFYQFLKNAKLARWIWIPVLFFLWHPISAETVSFNSALPDLLSAFFGWSAVVLWTGKYKRNIHRRVLAFTFLCLSFLSKESGVFFGFFLIGFDLLMNFDLAMRKKMINDAIIVLLTTMYVLSHNIVIHGLGIRDRLWGGDLTHHLATACKLFLVQFSLLVVPLGSSPVRDFTIVDFSSAWAWLGLGLWCFGIGAFIFFRKHRPALSFAIFFYLMFWFPVSNVLPAEGLIADRYLYILTMAMGLLISCAFEKLNVFPKMAGVLFVVFAAWSFGNSLAWKNSETLWKHAVDASPKSGVAWNEWGNVLASRKDYSNALVAYSKAFEIQPLYRDASFNRSYALLALKDARAKEAIQNHLKQFPKDPQAMDLMGTLYESEMNFDAAGDYSMRAVVADPGNWKYRYNLAEVYMRMKRFDEAIEQLLQGLKHAPGRYEILKNLGAAYCLNGQYQECVNVYEEIAITHPDRAHEISNDLQKAGQLLDVTQGKNADTR